MANAIEAVESVPGVESVENRLEPHESSENIPALQGGPAMPGTAPRWMPRNWTPGLQLLGGVATGGALLYATRFLVDRLSQTDGTPADSEAAERTDIGASASVW